MRVIALLGLFLASVAHATDSASLSRAPLDAVTVQGDKVLLHPNGRWEFVDAKKAEEAKRLAGQYPENQVLPPQAQGGFLGIGRVIMPGDKDYNRGSLSPKSR